MIGRGERLQGRAREGAQRAADEDRGQLAAVETEHEPKYRRQASPDARHRILRRSRIGDHGCQPPRRSAGATRRPHRCGPGGDGVLHRRTRPGQRRPAGGVRHVRAPRVEPGRGVQRGAHPGHHAGHRRVPGRAGHHRAAVHRPRHPRAVRAGVGVGAGGAGRQRRCGDDRFGRPLHPDAGGQPRHPDVQPRPRQRSGRRHRGHAVAQPAARRRLQVQPAQRRTRRHRRHRRDRQAGQRDPARRAQGGEAGAAGPGAADRAAPRLHGRLRRRPAERRRRARHPRREASASAPTRWAGPASTTGARSPNATTWT